ncbi:MAG: alcohol dehydrogenase, partial [Streptomyces sp.]|nr:alcohol dehydrogenase [Streptomyces sp.]NUR67026.1 alcohol dehydrogenase [Streptomyces sp.]
SGEPSRVDTRTLALKDVTAVGVLSASPGLEAAIRAYAEGSVDPRPLVAATVALTDVGAVLAGKRPADAGLGPKILVDPRRG